MSRVIPVRVGGRAGERGSAMLVVATILAALLAGGGIALYLQLQSTRSASLTKSNRSSLYCAEAGIAAAQAIVTNQVLDTMLDADPANDPTGYPVQLDIDGDGTIDVEVTIEDNDDELSPTPNDKTHDLDGRVLMVSRCLQNPEVPRQVVQLLDINASGHNYRSQGGGGAGATGNLNGAP